MTDHAFLVGDSRISAGIGRAAAEMGAKMRLDWARRDTGEAFSIAA
jgi:hypothetical protein